jgi:hypothetical protein
MGFLLTLKSVRSTYAILELATVSERVRGIF